MASMMLNKLQVIQIMRIFAVKQALHIYPITALMP